MNYKKRFLFFVLVFLISSTCFALGKKEITINLKDSVVSGSLSSIVKSDADSSVLTYLPTSVLVSSKTKELPNPYKEGYTFLYWSLSPNGSDVSSEIEKIEDEATLYAIWIPNDCIVYVYNDENELLGTVIKKYDEKFFSIPDYGLAKEHYYLSGWYDSNTQKSYSSNDSIRSEVLKISPVWEKQQYKVTIQYKWSNTFSANDDLDHTDIINVEYENTLANSGYVPNFKGYVFDHYLIKGEEYSPDSPVLGNIEISAYFKKLYCVSFLNGEQTVFIDVIPEGSHVSEPDITLKKMFCIFSGWKLKETTDEFDFSTFVVNEDIVIEAFWRPDFGLIVLTSVLCCLGIVVIIVSKKAANKKSLEQQRQALPSIIDEFDAEVLIQKKEIDEITDNVLQACKDARNSGVTINKTIFDELEDDLKQINAVYSQIIESVKEIRSLYQQDKIFNATKKASLVREMIENLKGLIDSCEEKLNSLNKTVKKKIQDIKEQIGNIEIKITGLKDGAKKVNDAYLSIKQKVDELNINDFENDISSLESSIQQIKDTIENIEKSFSQCSKTVDNSTNYQIINNELNDISTEINEARKIITKRIEYAENVQERLNPIVEKKLVFADPFLWITLQIVIDENWNSSLNLISSNGRSFSIPVFSPKIKGLFKYIPGLSVDKMKYNGLPTLDGENSYHTSYELEKVKKRQEKYLKNCSEAYLKYKEEVRIKGKKDLIKALSLVPAPGIILIELLSVENINHIIDCIAEGEVEELTIQNPLDLYDSLSKGELNMTETKKMNGKESLESYFDQLNSLIGLQSVKKDVLEMTSVIKMNNERKKQGKKPVPMSLHLVFTGNPGTGKTTVARLIAGIYHELGVLKKGQLIEVDRTKLVGGYVGQTAIKTTEEIQKALGGVLFVDEAYSLYSESGMDYGKEAIDTLLKAMEDNRDKFVVILAGYTNEMKKLISMNPGLESRFNKYIEFPDYEPSELKAIFIKICEDNQFELDKKAEEIVEEKIKLMYENRNKNFSNARAIRNMFEAAVQKHASNWSEKTEQKDEYLNKLFIEDF